MMIALTPYLILMRPKFIYYSAITHTIGVLEAMRQGHPINIGLFLSLQFTITITHLMTHLYNEYGDFEVDKLNEKNGSWTGGSKVLKNNLLSKETALRMGVVFSGLSIAGGINTMWMFYNNAHNINALFTFAFYGISVLFVSIAYSVKPFQFSYNALGEVIVSYVLTFVAPILGCVIQNGLISRNLLFSLMPLFINNMSRMIVMNIPDRDGDLKGGKNTSVVLLGEERSVALNNLMYLINYVYIVPNLPIHEYVKFAYLSILPYRWWQSLRINKPGWWSEPHYYDSIPFHESLTVLFSGIAVCVGLYCQYIDESSRNNCSL